MSEHQPFEAMKQFDDAGVEYWSARAFAKTLEYSEYRHFLPVIKKAVESCVASGQLESDHFEEILAMVRIGSGARRKTLPLRLLSGRAKW